MKSSRPAKWSQASPPQPQIPAPEQFTEPPVIIGGCARSGTTLLISILSCHPRIYTIPDETQLLCPGAFAKVPTCDSPLLTDLHALLGRSKISKPCRRWCEKTPRNAFCFPTIREAMPDAKLVSLVRDGRDVVTSRHPGNPADYWVPPSRWLRETSAALATEGVYTIRYEDIVQNYTPTVRDLVEWIGESWADELRDYPAYARIRESRAWGHEALPVHANSIGRWRAPEHAERIGWFDATPGTAEMLDRLGYT